MTEDNRNNTPDIYSELLIRGLNAILRNEKDPIRKTILSSYSDIILPRLDALDPNIQNGILEGILAENPAVFIEDDGWWNYINRAIDRLDGFLNPDSTDSMQSFVLNSGLYVLLNRVKDLREEVNWFDVLLKLSDATLFAGSKCQGFSTVLGWLIQADPENLRRLLYRTETKSYPSKLKSDLYKLAVDLGILDVKIARRIRSDTSGTLSSDLLAYLFENRSAYSDDVFQDLVTQFSDTKHKWVARYIALNMPMHLVPFLMGIKDDLALKILERRMELAEDSK